MDVTKVRIKNIAHGKNDRSTIVFAELYNAENNHLIICATLRYILDCIKERKYIVVP